FQAEDGIRARNVTGVQTCALPIWSAARVAPRPAGSTARSRVGEAALFGGIALYFLRGGVPPERLTFAVVACLVALAASLIVSYKIGRSSCRERGWFATGIACTRTR